MSARGHLIRPHTADVIVEAWGGDLATCVDEAVMALIELVVEPGWHAPAQTMTVVLDVGTGEEVLLRALDEVIFVLDTAGAIPVAASIHQAPGGELELMLQLADRSAVETTGAGPKAIARSNLSVDVGDDGARCSFLVDV